MFYANLYCKYVNISTNKQQKLYIDMPDFQYIKQWDPEEGITS